MPAARKITQDFSGIGLDALISVALRTRGADLFLREPARKEAWTGLPPANLTYADLDGRAGRLAALLALSRLPERSQALILAPLGAEAVIAMLAALRLGLSPVLLPLSVSPGTLQHWLDAAGPCLCITVTRCGDLEPARLLREAASRSFNARLICAFGADVPDGAVPIDAVIGHPGALQAAPVPKSGPDVLSIRLETSHGERQTMREADIFGAAVALAEATGLTSAGRVLSLMMSPSLCALASGPYLSLLSGAEYLPVGLFSLSALWSGIADEKPVTLVAPAAIEGALHKAGIIGHESVRNLVLIHCTAPLDLVPAPDHTTRMFDIQSDAQQNFILNPRRRG
jgi:hypothetical protein